MNDLFKLIRPHQYIKNLLILMPAFFAGELNDPNLFLRASVAFVAFSIAASAIYIFNDYFDTEEDRLHPTKKLRPLASGAVSMRTGLILACVLAIAGTSLMAALSLQALAVLGLYLALNVGYSLHLKHVAIIDVTIISIGFVLRLFVGSVVTSTPLSSWIVIMTFLLALFIALAKRRDDTLLFLETGTKMRKVIDGYNLQLIDGAMSIMASVVIVSYLLYTTSTAVIQRLQTEHVYLTTLFVIIGVMRYLQITFVQLESGSPTRIVIKDRFLQVTILAWALSFVWIIYL